MVLPPADADLRQYRLADPKWFLTQPQFGLSEGTHAFDLPTVNLDALGAIPSHFLIMEFSTYAMVAWGLWHAARRNELGLFFGIAALGSCLEVIGVTLVHAHYHPKYLVMLGFLPLKEALWYPLTIYPLLLAVRPWSFTRNLLGEAALVGLMQSLSVMQYESCGYRDGVQMVATNPNFPLANPKDLLTRGPYANMYANFIIAVVTTFLSRAMEERGGFNQKKVFGVLAVFGYPLVATLGFMPLNVFKFIGFAALHRRDLLAHLLPPRLAPHAVFEKYRELVQTSPATEGWALTLLLLFAGYCSAVMMREAFLSSSMIRVTPEGRRSSVSSRGALTYAFVSPVVYNLTLGLVIALADTDGSVPRSQAFLLWLSLFCAVLASHRFVCDGNRVRVGGGGNKVKLG